MVINTEGNTTSNDSVSFRTGPVPPQAGALLSGLAINHTTVLLNWTLPELKLLRGYVLSYAVHYKDILENVEYTYVNDLDGTARSVIVSPLKPSRDYSFQASWAIFVHLRQLNVQRQMQSPKIVIIFASERVEVKNKNLF